MEQQYYELTQLDNTDAEYRAVVSERSDGKSYAVKYKALVHAYESDGKFAYIRRWKDEVTQTAILEYFEDMVVNDKRERPIYELTNGEYDCVDVYSQKIYLAKTDESGKVVRGKQIGKAFALILETKSKSRAYVNYDMGIFEEFITDKGYLPNELKAFKSIISTVFRRRRAIIYLVGNTLTPLCPYFDYWGIAVYQLKQGTIRLIEHNSGEVDEDGNPITVRVALEYPEHIGKPSQLFFEDDKMIRTGAWDTDEYPRLKLDLSEYVEWYKILLEYGQFRYWILLLTEPESDFPFLYVYPCTKRVMTITPDMRIVSDKFSIYPYWTKQISQYKNDYDKLVCELLDEEKVVFSDDLTGTTFYQCIRGLGGI